MSNNEVFDKLFTSISKKIINKFLKKIKESKVDTKFRYTNDLDSKVIKNSLIENIDNIVTNISKNLNIESKNSIKIILEERINSDNFIKNIDNLTTEITSNKRIDIDDLRNFYYNYLTKNIIGGGVKEKILTISKESSFKLWLLRRWKLVGCGYSISILILLITYYVFLT